MEVSVVIPVYNAAPFLRESVESALQPQVKEIILVEDGSVDNSLEICQALERAHTTVRLLRHPNGENKGAGASRNFGIEHARYSLVAFLDADDYFLPHRFDAAEKVFSSEEDVDGVYDAVGTFNQIRPEEHTLYSVTRHIEPSKLLHYLLRGTYGHFHTNGLVVSKEIFDKSGYFDTTLRLHQDSELWLRLAHHGRLLPGVVDRPVTMVRRHSDNRITHANDESRFKFWKVVITYFKRRRVSRLNFALIVWKYSYFSSRVLRRSRILALLTVLCDRHVCMRLITGKRFGL